MKLDLLQKHYQPMKISNSSFLDRSAVLALAIGLAASIMALPLFALTDAAKARDTNAVHAIFGPEGHELMSPDIVQASEGFNHFVKRLSEKTELVRESDSKERLEI